MSVGASSIKRAARTAQEKQATDPVDKPEAKTKSRTKSKPAEALTAEKKPETEKPEDTKGTKREKEAKGAREAKSGHEAYGIGQQLPVHLL